MKEELNVITVALGGLLHDIGKFYQRASTKRDNHEKLGDECFEEHFAEKMSIIFSPHEINWIRGAINNHHTAVKYVSQADRISARVDRKEREEGDPSKEMLISIFEHITLQDSEKRNRRKFCYKIVPLSLKKEDVFPQLFIEKDQKKEYEVLWEGFVKELPHIPTHSKLTYFNALYGMLQKYTSFIPSAAYKVEPDISLFDHLKTTSALATCLYIYENEEHKNPLPFILVGGDISGVQNFIYRIAKAQGVGGIAKRLRGRSFYLFLLQETVAKYIIYKTGLLIPNVLYSGGGRFELLLPNTQKVKKILEETKYEINKWLFEQYGGEIGLILEEIEASEDDLKNYNTLLIRLDEKLSRGKRKKYFSLMKENSFWVENPQPHIKICKVCGISEVKNDIPCEVCEKHKEIGARLPFTEYILFTSSKDTTIDGLEVSFEKFGSVYLIEKGKFKEEWLKSENLIEAEKIIQEKEIDIIKSNIQFIANIVPIATESFSIKEEGVEEDIKVEKGHVLSFEILADASIGDKKIGLLKMDVDNLGLIFGRGIKEKSISRVSTLSRLLTTFFCGYINQICHELFLQWKKDKNNLWEHKDKVEEIFYIVYAGGDDLLIIGPSSEMPKLALKIRDAFKEYTCDNPDITISAGIFFCKPKYPVSLAAKGVAESLEKSKKDKNSITIFDDTVSWEKYKELLEFGESLFQYTQEEKIPRGFLYKVLMIHKQYKKGEDYNYIPIFLYFLSRNIKVKEIIEEIKEKGIKEFEHITLPVNYALLKSRKEGGKK